MSWLHPKRGPDPYSFRTVRYDLLKELTVALGVIAILVLALSAALSSPDVAPDTIQRWSTDDPVDFVTTATSELAGASSSAGYGPPYNSGTGSIQHVGILHPQEWAGVHQNVDPVNQFVLDPLRKAAPGNAPLGTALSTFDAAGADKQTAWLDAYTKSLADATEKDGAVVVADGDYGPIPALMTGLLASARSGGLDGLLLSSGGTFYQTDYTGPLLFMGDGGHLKALAEAEKLLGTQWGVMNETGRYPGQAWLWLYTMWYQIAPYNSPENAANTDLLVVLTMGVLSLLLLLVPFIPGLRDIPRWIPIHRLIWRRFYAEQRARH